MAIITNIIIPSSNGTGQGSHSPGGGAGPEAVPPLGFQPHGQSSGLSGPSGKTATQQNTSKTVNKNFFDTNFIVFKNRKSIVIKKINLSRLLRSI